MKDVMLDIETLSTAENAMVIQIGAVYFDRERGASSDRQFFKCNVDWESYRKEKINVDIDPTTLLFWFNCSHEARKSVTDQTTTLSVYDAFYNLNNFLADAKNIWCHPNFDYKILEWYMKELNIKPHFKYSSARDLRTLLDLSKYEYHKHHKRATVHHDALADCLFQVEYTVGALNKLKGKKI